MNLFSMPLEENKQNLKAWICKKKLMQVKIILCGLLYMHTNKVAYLHSFIIDKEIYVAMVEKLTMIEHTLAKKTFNIHPLQV